MTPCPPPPPEPPTVDVVEAAPRLELAVPVARWYGERSAYADQLRGCLLVSAEDVEALRVERDELAVALARVDREVVGLRRRPTWGVVAGVGAGGLVAGAALVVAAAVLVR